MTTTLLFALLLSADETPATKSAIPQAAQEELSQAVMDEQGARLALAETRERHREEIARIEQQLRQVAAKNNALVERLRKEASAAPACNIVRDADAKRWNWNCPEPAKKETKKQ